MISSRTFILTFFMVCVFSGINTFSEEHFYVHPDGGKCESSMDDVCSRSNPCKLDCPFTLDSFKNANVAKVFLFPGHYNVTDMIYSSISGFQMAHLTRQNQSVVVESLSKNDEMNKTVLIVEDKKEYEHYTVNIFYLSGVDEFYFRMEGIEVLHFASFDWKYDYTLVSLTPEDSYPKSVNYEFIDVKIIGITTFLHGGFTKLFISACLVEEVRDLFDVPLYDSIDYEFYIENSVFRKSTYDEGFMYIHDLGSRIERGASPRSLDFTLSRSSFEGINGVGSAFLVYIATPNTKNNITIDGVDFTNNKGCSAIFLDCVLPSNVQITNTSFENNTNSDFPLVSGRFVFPFHESPGLSFHFTIGDCRFISNEDLEILQIYVDISNVELENEGFNLFSKPFFRIYNSTFEKNVALGVISIISEGLPDWFAVRQVFLLLSLENSHFIENNVSHTDIFIFRSDKKLSPEKDLIVGLQFNGSQFLRSTGSSIVTYGMLVFIQDSEFSGNQKTPLVVHDTTTSPKKQSWIVLPSIMVLESCVFEYNVGEYGGGVYAENSVIITSNTKITNNIAKFGGGVFLLNSYFTLDIGEQYVTLLIQKISPSLISNNLALSSGGGIYIHSDLGFWIQNSSNAKEIDFSKNMAQSIPSDLIGNPVSFQLDRSSENTCTDLANQEVWMCYLNQMVILDGYQNRVKTSTYQPFTIACSFPDENLPSVAILTSEIGESGISFPKPLFTKNYKNSHLKKGFVIDISFNGVVKRTTLHFKETENEIWIPVVAASVFCVLSLFYCCCLVCLTFVWTNLFAFMSFCGVRSYVKVRTRKQEEDMRLNFGKYNEDSLFDIFGSISTGTNEEDNENSSLLRDVEIKLDDYHIFKGDIFGRAMIYFVDKASSFSATRLYPVFKGNFKSGRRCGHGMELRFNKVYKKEEIESTLFWNKYRKFSGMYDLDVRDGKGTEFDENGRILFIGEWKEGHFTRIIWNNLQLSIIDLRSEVSKNRQIYPKDREFEEGDEDIDSVLFEGTWHRYGKSTKKDCVVKLFKDCRRIGPEAHYKRSERIERNIKILSLYPHPLIISYFGWSGFTIAYQRTEFGYVMENFGCSLYDYFTNRKYNKEEQIGITIKNRILFQVAMGMEHIIEKCGLIHRDLKANNVLIDRFHNIKICDFDFSVMSEEDFSGKKNEERVAGSPFHIGPEVLSQNSFDSKSDVYGFGILMYQILYEKMVDPFDIFRLKKCHVCGDPFVGSFSGMELVHFMETHYTKCGEKFRPVVTSLSEEESREEVEGESDDEKQKGAGMSSSEYIEDWQIELMRSCWREDSNKRPTFKEIVELFSNMFQGSHGVVKSGRGEKGTVGPDLRVGKSINSFYRKKRD